MAAAPQVFQVVADGVLLIDSFGEGGAAPSGTPGSGDPFDRFTIYNSQFDNFFVFNVNGSADAGTTPTPTPTPVDTHDGGKKRDEHFRKQKEAKERFRDQIRMALDGPQAQEIIPALQALAEPGAGALEYRVKMDRLLQQAEVWRMVRAAAEAYARNEREIDEDDEEVLTFL